MEDIIEEQKNVLAKPVGLAWGVSSTGKEQASVQFELLEGPDEGRTITAFLYFTQESNTERSIESLQHCGCTFPENDIYSEEGFGSQDVRLVIEHEEWEGKTRAKVKWINSSKPFVQEMDEGMAASFKERMRANLQLAKNKGAGASVPWE